MIDTRTSYLRLLKNTMTNGVEVTPRNYKCMEVLNQTFIFNPEEPFLDFPGRNYNYDYFKAEMLWKLGADKYDLSICQHAKIWNDCINSDETLNSNYGQFWFANNQWLNVVMELIRDEHSRRAVIPMLSAEHLVPGTNETVS